ncbi:MAG TPA: metallophosphoesterase, partial [Bradyrhizobium sp.]|nr:metallophosphoesterase [Bradyrhizobium sp.]
MISRRHFLRLAGGLGATGISTVAYGFGEPALRLRVTRYNIQPPQWPAGFKLKIAVLADLHACFIPCSEWAPVLGGLRAPLGVHAVLGNHDYWEDKAVQRDGQGT